MLSVEFPRVGTIAQAAAESGVPAYRVRQLCKTGQVRSVRCGRKVLVNCCMDAGRRRADATARYPPGGDMNRKSRPGAGTPRRQAGKIVLGTALQTSRLQSIRFGGKNQ